ncbi:Uncharacterised protein [Klebsiella pneumoniae]|nr:Uncharacterised protein [Klebsiella pneumoniae]
MFHNPYPFIIHLKDFIYQRGIETEVFVHRKCERCFLCKPIGTNRSDKHVLEAKRQVSLDNRFRMPDKIFSNCSNRCNATSA